MHNIVQNIQSYCSCPIIICLLTVTSVYDMQSVYSSESLKLNHVSYQSG